MRPVLPPCPAQVGFDVQRLVCRLSAKTHRKMKPHPAENFAPESPKGRAIRLGEHMADALLTEVVRLWPERTGENP
jgi:hypothetical protein